MTAVYGGEQQDRLNACGVYIDIVLGHERATFLSCFTVE
jgi:hypothetical protein